MKASERYPAEELKPPIAVQQVTVCSISNAIATSGCVASGTAYDIDLPVDKVPRGICQVHGGSPTLLGRRVEQFQQKVKEVPRSIIPVPGRVGEADQVRELVVTKEAVHRRARQPVRPVGLRQPVGAPAHRADVVLPVAQWAEEDGTTTNLEGRVIRRR
jgi:hypothetical protein